MKTSSIAFIRAIVLSLCLVLPSGFLAMAAEGDLVPSLAPNTAIDLPPQKPASVTNEEEKSNTPSNFKNSDLQDDEQDDLSTSVSAGAPSVDGERPEDDQVPVGIKVNGMLLDTDMTVYLPSGYSQDEILVPLGMLADLLSFAITSNAGDKKAEGFFIKEENTFQLDLNAGEVLVAGKKRSLKKGEAEIQQNQIYVKSSSLEEWFGIKIALEMSNLVLEVTSEGTLPFQERLKRIANAKKKEKTFTFDPIKPENAALAPYKSFSYPSLYITGSVGGQKNSTGSSFRGRTTVQGNQDLAKFETNYVLSGLYDSIDGTRDINNARFTMQKRDLNRNLLGPLHAGRIAFGDIAFPSVPLFVGGQRGAGFQASSDPRLGARYANNTENFILDGDAPVGYDAELYRNGTFIAFQQIGADGRFNFENVDLTTGYNNFEIILYGPQGQKTVVKRDIVRGSRMLRKGELQYDLAAGTPMGELIPISKINRRDDRTPGMSGQAFYGLSEFLTMGGSAYSGPQDASRTSVNSFLTNSVFDEIENDDDTVRSTGAAVSAVTSFLGMNLQGQLLGADKGRRAYEAAINARPFGLNIGASHTEYKNFLEDDQDIKSRSEISLYRNFGKFNTRFQIQQRDFLDREDETIFEHVLAFKLFSVNINNDLIKTVSKEGNYDNFEGQLTAAASLYGIRFRSSLIYDLEPEDNSRYRRFSFSGQKNLGNRTSLRAEGIHDFDAKTDILNLRLSKDYDKFGLDFDAVASTDQEYAFTVGMRVALQPDQNNNYIFVDPKTGGQAALGARAFIDNNLNNIYDEGVDKIIEGIAFKASTGSNAAQTGKDGIAYVTNLGESPLRLSVQTESIPDIYLAPKFDHRDLIPRRGSTPVIDFPFVKMSEISGYLLHLKKGVEGIIVRLVSGSDGKEVEKTETDIDGYFIFPAVKGGNYKIAFGLPDRDFMSLNVDLDASIEDPQEMKFEASDELAEAAKQAAAIKPSANAGQKNIDRMNAPAGEIPNIDDPLEEEDLKPLDEKAIEGIITQ